jgi:hypothetical protein
VSDYFARLADRNQGASDVLPVPRLGPVRAGDEVVDDPFATVGEPEFAPQRTTDVATFADHSGRDGVLSQPADLRAAPDRDEPFVPLPLPLQPGDLGEVVSSSPPIEPDASRNPAPDRSAAGTDDSPNTAVDVEARESFVAPTPSPEPTSDPAPIRGPQPEPVTVPWTDAPDLRLVPGLAEMDRILLTQAGILPPVDSGSSAPDLAPATSAGPESPFAATVLPMGPTRDDSAPPSREFVTPSPSPDSAPTPSTQPVAPVVIGALTIEIVDGDGEQSAPPPRVPRATNQLGRSRALRSIWGW